ncbi:DUF3772 domain-containing protein, partial [Methylobacterium sp. WL103]
MIAAGLAALLLAPGLGWAQSAPPPAPAAGTQTKTPDAKFSETKPAEGKPADAKPADAKPAPPKPEMSEALKAVRAKLDAAKNDLAAREKELARTDLGTPELSAIRDGVGPVTDEIRTIIGRLDAPLESARERLTQLGPKPKDAEESPEVAQERVERDAAVSRIDETQRLARSLLVQGDQIIDRVSNRRRESFTKGLFERSLALVSPQLWRRVAADVPRDVRSLQSALSDILLLFSRNGTLGNLLLLGLAFGVSVALYFGRRNIAPRLGRRDAAMAEPTRRQTLLGAWRVLLLGTVPAVIGSYAVYYALDGTDLLPSRLLPVAGAILAGLAFIAFVEALCDGLLSPDKPQWRPAPVSDAAAIRVTRLAVGIATVITVVKSIEALN